MLIGAIRASYIFRGQNYWRVENINRCYAQQCLIFDPISLIDHKQLYAQERILDKEGKPSSGTP